ncbi:glutamine amidotransferase [Paraoerskovia sediminicola]|uniref:Glutamine amidotransferase n=1 Tax=Paraoerskovia sediminicola TaxID=1138587 RepID=A0ABM8G329_9CELL|nr:glutamine amidotransferase [Paraoerskovia sediminicola]
MRMEAAPLPAIDLDDYSGVFVGGSPYNASTPEHEKSADQVRVEKELKPLLDEIVDRDFPFFGACYGVGTLGLHQGAVIDEHYGEEVGPIQVAVTDAGRDEPLLADMPDVFDAYVGHKEACRTLPEHAVLLATSDKCPVQMFRVRENLFATQFHPELDADGIAERIRIYRQHGYFPPDEAEQVIARVYAGDVTVPHRLLRSFVERYARS